VRGLAAAVAANVTSVAGNVESHEESSDDPHSRTPSAL
jgi:hypothetical protein